MGKENLPEQNNVQKKSKMPELFLIKIENCIGRNV
jgi:hypothetical protein